ncbi:MAG: hypothetical protein AAF728_08800 [Cyanobacteria bacterium P01_D01_bin.128]
MALLLSAAIAVVFAAQTTTATTIELSFWFPDPLVPDSRIAESDRFSSNDLTPLTCDISSVFGESDYANCWSLIDLDSGATRISAFEAVCS